MRLNINYVRKQHALAFSVLDNKDRLLVSEVTHLGDFLNGLHATINDCESAITKSDVDGSWRKINDKFDPELRVDMYDELQVAALPTNLTGRTILDIGGYDGYVSKHCLNNGASRAIVIDNQQYATYTFSKYPFGWGSPRRFEGVEYIGGDILDISPWMYLVPADMVICYNVIYHLVNPIQGLVNLALITKNDLYISSSYKPGDKSEWFFNPDQCRRMYFTPSKSGLEDALKFVGLMPELIAENDVEVVYHCVKDHI